MSTEVGQRGRIARDVGNPELREARLRRGWTEDDVAVRLHQLAEELGEPAPGASGPQVGKWERGVRNPGRYYKPRLCLIFEATPEQIGLSRAPRLIHDVSELNRRRIERQQTATRRGTGALSLPTVDQERLQRTLQHLWPVDGPLLEGLEATAAEYGRRCETEAPSAVLPGLRDHLSTLEALMSRTQPPALEARLRAISSRIAELTGFSSFVSGNRVEAFNAYAVAEVLGREAGSGELVAMVLAARSRLHSQTAQERRDPQRAIALLDAAELAASPAVPPALRAWIYGRRSEEHAEQGDEVASGRDLDDAYRVLGSSTDHNLFSSLDSAWLDNYRAVRAVKLGHAEEAISVYEAVLQGTDRRLLWERTLALTHLAAAWAQRREVERACDLLTEAVGAAADVGNLSGLRMAARVRERHLGNWRRNSHVRELDDAIRAARGRVQQR